MKNLSFEKLFAAQIAKIQENFPENVINSFWSKKEALEKEVSGLNLNFEEKNIIPFVPVIPTRVMNCIDQLRCFTGSPKELVYFCTKNFLYNESSARNLSSVSEVGFILGIQCLSLSDIKIPQNTDLHQIGNAISKEIAINTGCVPVNHVEALAIACMTTLLPFSSEFLAINFSWDGYEFARVFNGRDIKYAFGWLTPEFNEISSTKEVLIPVFRKIV